MNYIKHKRLQYCSVYDYFNTVNGMKWNNYKKLITITSIATAFECLLLLSVKLLTLAKR